MRPLEGSTARQTGGHERVLRVLKSCAQPGDGEDSSTCRVDTNGRRIDRGSWGSPAQELTRCDASKVQGAARCGICLEDDAVLDFTLTRPAVVRAITAFLEDGRWLACSPVLAQHFCRARTAGASAGNALAQQSRRWHTAQERRPQRCITRSGSRVADTFLLVVLRYPTATCVLPSRRPRPKAVGAGRGRGALTPTRDRLHCRGVLKSRANTCSYTRICSSA